MVNLLKFSLPATAAFTTVTRSMHSPRNSRVTAAHINSQAASRFYSRAASLSSGDYDVTETNAATAAAWPANVPTLSDHPPDPLQGAPPAPVAEQLQQQQQPKPYITQPAKRERVSYKDRIQLSGELFEAVQHGRVFSDSKHYVDMLSTLLPATVIDKWKEEKDNPEFDLPKFISENFELPQVPGHLDIGPKDRCRDHIQELWPMLFRPADNPDTPHSSLIPLPYPYVVPGGRFREIYYWDSYFTALGLIADGHKEMALNMAKNFQHLIHTFGHVPNGNRFYYMSRSQPPFFVPLVSLLVGQFGRNNIIADFYQEALLEHAFWMDETDDPDRRAVTFDDSEGRRHTLNRYWDDNPVPREESWIEDKMEFEKSHYTDAAAFYRHIRAACESGWDFSSRWLADKSNLETIETTSILPVDLNTVLWFVEKKLAEWSEYLGQTSEAWKFRNMADRRKVSINELMWDAEEGFFYDYHLEKNNRTDCASLAAIYPLYFRLADQDQAEAIAEKLEKRFLRAGGLMTTLETSGQQWDAPNGWAPLQWMAIVGLENYGKTDLAEEIRARWLQLNEQVYIETGKMMEKYNVADLTQRGGGGEYPLQDGFGWTNGVFSAMSGHLDERTTVRKL